MEGAVVPVKVDLAAVGLDLAREAGLVDGTSVKAPSRPALALTGLAVRVVAVGWATVDLERASAQLGGQNLAGSGTGGSAGVVARPRDELLGADARQVGPPAGGVSLILLEPFTEGRLAGSLARRGEGPVALYVAPDDGDLTAAVDRLAAAGIRTRLGSCALGPGAVLLGRSAAGPQVLLVAVPSEP